MSFSYALPCLLTREGVLLCKLNCLSPHFGHWWKGDGFQSHGEIALLVRTASCGQVTDGNNPDEAVFTVEDRNATDLLFLHQFFSFTGGLIGETGDHAGTHDIPDPGFPRITADRDGANDNVPIGQNPYEAVALQYRQRSDVEQAHSLRCFLQRSPGIHGFDSGGHDLAEPGGCWLSGALGLLALTEDMLRPEPVVLIPALRLTFVSVQFPSECGNFLM